MKTSMRNVGALSALALATATACSTKPKGGDDQAAAPQAGGYDLATEVQGQPADGQPLKSDNLQLQFALGGNDKTNANLKLQGFECRFAANGAWAPCQSPLGFPTLRSGDLIVDVRAVLIDTTTNAQVTAKEIDLDLKVDLGDSVPTPGQSTLPTDVNGVRALADKLQVGSAYEVDVPVGMHVTEYATSKTVGVLDFYRIMPESDPYYLFNTSCVRDWDILVPSVSPAGEPLTYCNSTPTEDAYKAENEERLANNHIEIATDTKLITPDGQERMSISVFDSDYELQPDHSRFGSVCANSQKRSITIPMLPNFFLGSNPEAVEFWICDAYLPDMNGQAVQWRVGAFYSVDHIDWSAAFAYDRAVEMVYMARADVADSLDPNFAKVAQTRFLDVVSKLTP